ncbi:MAG: Lrp/AsnC family transcriptional regulator [Acidimicrobiales bacterium]
MLHAFVLVDAEPGRIASLAESLAEVEGITEVFSVAGGVCDLVAIVRVRHHDDLVDVVTRRIASLEGIESTTTLVAFQAFSRHDLEAIWDIGPA